MIPRKRAHEHDDHVASRDIDGYASGILPRAPSWRRAFSALILVGSTALTGGGCSSCHRDEMPGPGPTATESAPTVASSTASARVDPGGGHLLDEKIVFHQIRVDSGGNLLSWIVDSAPYPRVAMLSWTALVHVPDAPDGHKPYFTTSMFSPAEGGAMVGSPGWVHHPAGLAAMFIDTGLRMAAYTGDASMLEAIVPFVDHVIESGLTKPDDVWASVPYASANGGSLTYSGADDTLYCPGKVACGSGDGPGIIEPDKVGELGYALARLSETRDAVAGKRYLEVAVHCADALAMQVKPGDSRHSPWPFRVDAKTGKNVRDGYSANVLGSIRLFDWLIERGKGNVSGYQKVRDLAWAWLAKYPLRNQVWDGYFEDIPTQQSLGQNPNQYTPLEVARYIVEHETDLQFWLSDVLDILKFVRTKFTVDSHDGTFERGVQHGAEVMSEQQADMAKMGSHTARYASVLTALDEVAHDLEMTDHTALGRAGKSFNWATYTCSETGVVKVGDNDREGYWFSDGYGDWARHFLSGIAAHPAWGAPGENHLLRWWNGEVIGVRYETKRVRYTTTRPGGEERLRLAFTPTRVTVGDRRIETTAAADGVRYVVTPIEGSTDVTVDILRGAHPRSTGASRRDAGGVSGEVVIEG